MAALRLSAVSTGAYRATAAVAAVKPAKWPPAENPITPMRPVSKPYRPATEGIRRMARWPSCSGASAGQCSPGNR
ncbi:hypothetical protein G6F53_013938 [Rhizopus delemar]|nr:hypothetical protein G6F53_013938 [Rhizopus delemar]